MKKGEFDQRSDNEIDRAEFAEERERRRRVRQAQPRMTVEEISNALLILADAAEEAGAELFAARIRRVGTGRSIEAVPGWTAEDVMERVTKGRLAAPGEAAHWGYGVQRPTPGSDHRRSGRTTWMLAEAVALLVRDVPFEITAHDRRYEQELVMRFAEMAREVLREHAGGDRAVEAVVERHRHNRHSPERIELIDHHAFGRPYTGAFGRPDRR